MSLNMLLCSDNFHQHDNLLLTVLLDMRIHKMSENRCLVLRWSDGQGGEEPSARSADKY